MVHDEEEKEEEEEKKIDGEEVQGKVVARIKAIGEGAISINTWLKIFAMLCVGFFCCGWFIAGVYYTGKVNTQVNEVLEEVFDEKNKCVDWHKITPKISNILENASINLTVATPS